MSNHYRHHRVVTRSKQPASISYLDQLLEQPLLALGLILLFFLLMMKCLICHR